MDISLTKYGVPENLVHIYSEIDSTNLAAIRYARLAPPDRAHIFLAYSQTSGRGRLGNSFVSVAGAGIYLSILLPEGSVCPERLTPLAAVALAETLESSLGISPTIKWVNDIYLDGKKLAGILAEAVTSDEGKIIGFVLGMGINVYKNAITDEISDIATSLEECGAKIDDFDGFTASVVRSLYEKILAGKDVDALLSDYRARSIMKDKRITVMPVGAAPYEATALGISDDFSLLVRLDGGEYRHINSGDVKIKIER